MSFDINIEINKLNEVQRKAVISRSKAILILAGAGTGKTKVLTSRISYLISLGVEPSSILAVTFTNKAANEMTNRIKSMVNENVMIGDAWIGTFHKICNKIIATHYELLNLPKNYQTLDSDDQKSLIRRSIEEICLENPKDIIDKKECLLSSLTFINKAKELGFRPNNAKAKDLCINMGFDKIILDIYNRYEYIRELTNTIDFGDMILYVIELFRDFPEIKYFYSNKFSHVLVDEYQDTNTLQSELINSLSENNYLFVVGDDDQSIYGWRGAKIENILNFEKNNKDTEIFRLEENYRSTKIILSAANIIIKNNIKRHGKTLWTNGNEGEKIKVYETSSPEEEAEALTDNILSKIQNEGINPKDVAILYRNNSISRSFEGKLTERQIPYKIIGGISFWSRKEIKDMLSYLSLIANKDNDISFERVINVPTRGVGKKSIEKIRNNANENKISMFDSMSLMLSTNEIKGKSGNLLRSFQKIIESLTKNNISSSIYNTIVKILEETNLANSYTGETEEKLAERKLNLQELCYFAKNFKNEEEGLSDIDVFLSQAALQSESDNSKSNDCVQMMTIHASKGLEFKYVYLVGLEQGIFPSNRSLSQTIDSLEEERRLAYVAITRAEIELTISFSTWRYNQSSGASMFLLELPKELLSYKKTNSFSYNSNYSNNRNNFQNKVTPKIMEPKFDNNLDDSKNKYVVGQMINHKKFGKGEILKIESESEYDVYTIKFGFIGQKRIMKKK